VVLLVDPRARTAVATMRDGEVLRLRTVGLPRSLRRDARVAWSVTAASGGSPALTFRRVRAYDSRGRVVGSYR
jgi:hypothetical protein